MTAARAFATLRAAVAIGQDGWFATCQPLSVEDLVAGVGANAAVALVDGPVVGCEASAVVSFVFPGPCRLRVVMKVTSLLTVLASGFLHRSRMAGCCQST